MLCKLGDGLRNPIGVEDGEIGAVGLAYRKKVFHGFPVPGIVKKIPFLF